MKKIQKQYERKLRVNQNNDVFTTFQKQSHNDCSPLINQNRHKAQSLYQNQHQHIESLKSTLKSLVPASMEMTKQFSRHGGASMSEDQRDSIQNEQYKFKLDQLTRNLQEIASKCHFSPASIAISKQNQITYFQKQAKNKTHFQKAQTISRYQLNQPQIIKRYANNSSLQLPINRSHSFIEKQTIKNSVNHSKSIKKHDNSTKQIKIDKDRSSWSNNGSKSTKKSFSKKQIINESLGKLGTSKNLSKIFENYDQTSIEMIRGRQRSLSQIKKYQTIFKQKIHRSKITSILIADQIYTSSLDYLIKKTYEEEAQYKSQHVQSYRGGVQHIGLINSKIFGCGRDYYLRSIDGNYFHRFDQVPLSFSETEKSNSINVNFNNNQLKLFDFQKRQIVSSLLIDTKYSLMNKITRQTYLGIKSSLFGLDWRKKQHLVNLYKQANKDNCLWLNDPYSKTFWYHCDGQITILNQDFKKIKIKQLLTQSQFINYHWNRSGLNILAANKLGYYSVYKYQQFKEGQEIDLECQTPAINNVIIRDKQLIYSSKQGELIIKSIKK